MQAFQALNEAGHLLQAHVVTAADHIEHRHVDAPKQGLHADSIPSS